MTVLSPLARGQGSWNGGGLESTKSQPIPVLKQHVHRGKNAREKVVAHLVRTVSRNGQPTCYSQQPKSKEQYESTLRTESSRSLHRQRRAKSAPLTTRQGRDQVDLPKTFLTRRGALLLFSSPRNMAFSKRDNEKCYFYEPEDVAVRSALGEMGTLDKLTASVFQYVNQQQASGKDASPTQEEQNSTVYSLPCAFEDADLRTQPGGDFRFYLKNVKSQANFRTLLRSPSFRSLLSPNDLPPPMTAENKQNVGGLDKDMTTVGTNSLCSTKDAVPVRDSVKPIIRSSSARSTRSSTNTSLSFREITASIKSAPYHGRVPSATPSTPRTAFIPTPPSPKHGTPHPHPSDDKERPEQHSFNGSRTSSRHSTSSRSQGSFRTRDANAERIEYYRSPPDFEGSERPSRNSSRNTEFELSAPRVHSQTLSKSSAGRLQRNRCPDEDDGGSLADEGSEDHQSIGQLTETAISGGKQLSEGSWAVSSDVVNPQNGEHADEDSENDWCSEVIHFAGDDCKECDMEEGMNEAVGSSCGLDDPAESRSISSKASREPKRIYTSSPGSHSVGRQSPGSYRSGASSAGSHERRKSENGLGGKSSSKISVRSLPSRSEQSMYPQEGLDDGSQFSQGKKIVDSSGDVEEQPDCPVVEESTRAPSGDTRKIYIPENCSSGRTTPMVDCTCGTRGMESELDLKDRRYSLRASSGNLSRVHTPTGGSSGMNRDGGHTYRASSGDPSREQTPRARSSGKHTPPEEGNNCVRPSSAARNVNDKDMLPVEGSIKIRSDEEEKIKDYHAKQDRDGALKEAVVPPSTRDGGGDFHHSGENSNQDTHELVHLKEAVESTTNINTAETIKESDEDTGTKLKSPTLEDVDRHKLGGSSKVEPTHSLLRGSEQPTLTVLTVPHGSLGNDSSQQIPKTTPTPPSQGISLQEKVMKKGRRSPIHSAGKKKATFGGPQFEYVGSVAIDPYAPRAWRDEVDDMVAQELAKELSAQNLLEKDARVETDQKDEIDSLATDDEAIEAELKLKTKSAAGSKKKENRKKLAKEKAALREARRLEKQRRNDEMQALREKKRSMEEERRRLKAEDKRRQEELAETIAEAEQEAEMARQTEEDARQMMQEARRVARDERDARRKEEAEKRRFEKEKQKEERKKMEELARQREKEMADRLATDEERRALTEAARLERERLESLQQEERDRLEEEEQMRLEMEEEKIQQLERQAEREAVERLVREREAAEENRRKAELLMKQKQVEEEKRRHEEGELKAKEEARLMLIKLEEEQKREREQEKIRQIQRLEEEARAKVRRELCRRRARALRRREQNLEQKSHANGLRRTQGTTRPWVFTYYVHWPRDTYERRFPSGSDKGKRRSVRPKTAPPPLTPNVKALVADSSSAP